jgi:hypothetical protein
MRASTRIFCGLALTGVVAVFGLGMAYRCLPEAPVGAVPILGPPQEADIQVPIACRSATVPESDCTVAWNARHHRFFRQASPAQAKRASSAGERP